MTGATHRPDLEQAQVLQAGQVLQVARLQGSEIVRGDAHGCQLAQLLQRGQSLQPLQHGNIWGSKVKRKDFFPKYKFKQKSLVMSLHS